MNSIDVKNAELAIVISLYDVTKNLRQGRLKNLLKNLQVEGEKQARRIKKPTKSGMIEIKKALDEFEKISGWGQKQKHILTYVNTILLIIEKRNYIKINKLLIEIMDYHQRENRAPDGCFWSVEITAGKWQECFK